MGRTIRQRPRKRWTFVSQKLKNLSSRLKSFRAQSRRQNIYIVPSVTGLILFVLVFSAYLLSFADQNPWLASLALSGFAWYVVALFITHKMLSGLNLSSDGRIQNRNSDAKSGLRLDGVEIPELAGYAAVQVALTSKQKRYRVST